MKLSLPIRRDKHVHVHTFSFIKKFGVVRSLFELEEPIERETHVLRRGPTKILYAIIYDFSDMFYELRLDVIIFC